MWHIRGRRQPDGKTQSGRPWFRQEDNIRMELKEMEWRGTDWIHLAPNRVKWWAVMSMVMNVCVEKIIQYDRNSATLRFKPNSIV